MKLLEKLKKRFNKKANNKKLLKLKVGIAFGGGGTRGFAHLGVIKAFEEEGIVFDYVAGTSVGSLVGALYAKGLTSSEMIKISKKLKPKDIITSKLPFVPSKTEKLEQLIKDSIGDAVFSDLKKPFSVVAVDIVSAKELDITSGSVVKAVAGSCAVPAVFNPVKFGDCLLVDGGLTNTIPASVLRNKGCKYVISVDVNPGRGYGTKSTKLLDVLAVTIRIMMKENADKGKFYSDIVIEPNTKRFKSTKTEGASEMIEEGYLAAKEKMPEILKLLKIKTSKTTKEKALLKLNEKKLKEEKKIKEEKLEKAKKLEELINQGDMEYLIEE